MKRKDILRKLEERLARGEINEKTYLEIKARYESEPDEPEESEEAASPNVDLGSAIGGAVAQATADATRMANDAVRAVGDAMRAVDFSGGTTKLSDETIRIVGSGVVSGNPVKTHEFKSAGSARVQGSLIAEVAQVKATGGVFRVRGELAVDRIEAEDIELEATTAAFVKGESVVIGPHCKIDIVEAKRLSVHQSSEVRERRTAS